MTRATEINKGIMKIGKDFISIPKLERILSSKKAIHVPLKEVRGLKRKKGFQQKRLNTARSFTNQPGIITHDKLLLDGRHRSLARRHNGETTGIYKIATKKDLMKAKLSPEQTKNLESKLDEILEFANAKEQLRMPNGEYVDPMKVLDGRVAPRKHNPNFDRKLPKSSSNQPTIPHSSDIREIQEVRRGAMRKAKEVNKWGGRATRMGRDIGDSISGKPRRKDKAGREKKKEWEKSWFTQGAATLATAGGLMAGGKYLRDNPDKRDALYRKADNIKNAGAKKISKATRYILSSDEKLNELNSILDERLIEFDIDVDGTIYNKDGTPALRVSDARGKSARIHSGQSRKRDRRKKHWHERKENRDKLAVGAAAAAAGLGFVAGRKIKPGKLKIDAPKFKLRKGKQTAETVRQPDIEKQIRAKGKEVVQKRVADPKPIKRYTPEEARAIKAQTEGEVLLDKEKKKR